MSILTVQWDGNDINDPLVVDSHFLTPVLGSPPVSALYANRDKFWPKITQTSYQARSVTIELLLRGDFVTVRKYLRTIFNTDDGLVKRLDVTLENGQAGFINAQCINFVESDDESGAVFRAILVLDEDAYFQVTTPIVDFERNITTAEDTFVINNDGEADAHPRFTIRLDDVGANENPTRTYLFMQWRGNVGNNYPIRILGLYDSRASNGHANTDGSDILLFVDGVQQNDMWLQNPNSTSTAIWTNLNVKQSYAVGRLLVNSIAATGVPDSIELDSDISLFPTSGKILIGLPGVDEEVFRYDNIDYNLRLLYIAERAIDGTTANAHSAGDYIDWLQHTIYISFGNSNVSRPAPNPANEPMFVRASSTNNTWVYNKWVDPAYPNRPKQWTYSSDSALIRSYPKFEDDTSNSPDVAGISNEAEMLKIGQWTLNNSEIGITRLNAGLGKYTNDLDAWAGCVLHLKGVNTNIPAPTATLVWQTDSVNTQALSPGDEDTEVSMSVFRLTSTNFIPYKVEMRSSTVEITLGLILVGVGGQTQDSQLTFDIENKTTGQQITIEGDLALGDDILIDTYAFDFRYLANSQPFSKVSQRALDPPRTFYLPMAVGNNTITLKNPSLADIVVTTEFNERTGA